MFVSNKVKVLNLSISPIVKVWVLDSAEIAGIVPVMFAAGIDVKLAALAAG